MYSSVTATAVYQADEEFLTTNFYLSAKDDGSYGDDTSSCYPSIVSFEVTNPPNKTRYGINEPIDYTGIAVTIEYQDGTKHDVSEVCSFEPAQGTPFTEDVQLVEISCAPSDEPSYIHTGVKIQKTAKLQDADYTTDAYWPVAGKFIIGLGSKPGTIFNAAVISEYILRNSDNYLSLTDEIITKDNPKPNATMLYEIENNAGVAITRSGTDVTYLYRDENDKSLVCYYSPEGENALTEKEVDHIEIFRNPTKTLYKVGESISYSGLIVRVTYTDGSTADIRENLIISVPEGTSYDPATCLDVLVVYKDKEAHLYLSTLGDDDKELRLVVTQEPTVKISPYNDAGGGAYTDWKTARISAETSDGTLIDVTGACQLAPDLKFDENMIPFTGDLDSLDFRAATNRILAYVSNYTSQGGYDSWYGTWHQDAGPSLIDVYQITAGKTYLATGGKTAVFTTTNPTQIDTGFSISAKSLGKAFTSDSNGFLIITKNAGTKTYLFEKGEGDLSVEWTQAINWKVYLQCNRKYYCYVGDEVTYAGLKIKAQLRYNDMENPYKLKSSEYELTPAKGSVITASWSDETEVQINCLRWPSANTDDFNCTIHLLRLTSLKLDYLGSNIYAIGEELLTGHILTVKAIYEGKNGRNHGKREDVTDDAVYDPPRGTPIEIGMNTCTITYTNKGGETVSTVYNFIVVENPVKSLEIKNPDKTVYYPSDSDLDLSGCVVTAVFEDSTREDVTSECTFTPAGSDYSNMYIEVSFTRDGVTVTGKIPIIFMMAEKLICTRPPNKREFFIGDQIDYTGIEITAMYTDGTSRVVTDDCTFSPQQGADIESKVVTVRATYEYQSIVLNDPVFKGVQVLNSYVDRAVIALPEAKYPIFITDYKYYPKWHYIRLHPISPYPEMGTDMWYQSIHRFPKTVNLYYLDTTSGDIKPAQGVPSKISRCYFDKVEAELHVELEVISKWYDNYRMPEDTLWVDVKYGGGIYDDFDFDHDKYSEPNVYPMFVWDTIAKKTSIMASKSILHWLKSDNSACQLISYISGSAIFLILNRYHVDFPIDEELKNLLTQYPAQIMMGTWGDMNSTFKNSAFIDIPSTYIHILETCKENDTTTGAYIIFQSEFDPPALTIVGAQGLDITPPDRHYVIGDNVDYTGIKVIAKYSDGRQKDVSNETLSYSLPAGSEITTQTIKTVTVTYTDEKGDSCSGDFKLEFNKLRKLVITPPSKVVYKIGEVFNKAGLQISAEYNDGSLKNVTEGVQSSHDDYFMIDFNTQPRIYITYEEDDESITGYYEITINKLGSLIVKTEPVRTAYSVGDTLDYTGLKIVRRGIDDDITECEITNYVISPPEGTRVTDYTPETITITYADEIGDSIQTSFDISIEQVRELLITQPPSQTVYKIGEALDYSGIALQAQTSSGITTDLYYGDARLTFTPPEGTIVSADMDINLPITITYTEGAHSRSTALTLTVDKLLSLTVSLLPRKTQYQVGEEISYDGISFIVTSTLETKTISSYDVVFDLPEGTIAQLHTPTTITATYTNEYDESISTTFDISIGVLNSLRIISQPTKTLYEAGEALDYTGLRLVAETSNGIQTALSASDEGLYFEPAWGTVITTAMGAKLNIVVTYFNEFSTSAGTSFTVDINTTE